MKQFIIRGFWLLLFALTVVVAVFLYVQYQLTAAVIEVDAPAVDTLRTSVVHKMSTSSVGTSTPNTVSVAKQEVQTAPTLDESRVINESVTESIAGDQLPLSQQQQQLLTSFGIDPATVTVTPAMIDCAQMTLGVERYTAIVGGDAPTFFEGASLLGCITE